MQVLTPDDHFDGFGAAGTGQFDAKTLTFLTSDVIHVGLPTQMKSGYPTILA